MRALMLAACAALSACAAAAAPSPPPPTPVLIPPLPTTPPPEPPPFDPPPLRSEATVRDAAAQALARELFAGLAERVVEARFNRVAAGPGRSMLADITLFERPQPSHYSGLCELRAHVVRPSGLHAGAVDSQQRFYLSGTVLPPSRARPVTPPPGTCDVPVAEYFVAPSADEARAAIETFELARGWAAEGTAAVVVDECVRYLEPCSDGKVILAQQLRPQLIREITRVPCEPASPRPEIRCWRYSLADAATGAPAAWTVLMRGPTRPMHVTIRQDPPPVS